MNKLSLPYLLRSEISVVLYIQVQIHTQLHKSTKHSNSVLGIKIQFDPSLLWCYLLCGPVNLYKGLRALPYMSPKLTLHIHNSRVGPKIRGYCLYILHSMALFCPKFYISCWNIVYYYRHHIERSDMSTA